MARKERARRKIRLGLVGFGCVIGVVASSTVFFAVSQWRSSGLRDSAGVTPPTPEVASSVAAAKQPFDETTTPQFDAANIAGAQEPNSIASLSPSTPESTERSVILDTKIVKSAPIILSYVPALEQPPLTVGVSGYLPRQEPNPSFLPYETPPEFFETAIALPKELARNIDPLDLSVAAITPPERSVDTARVAAVAPAATSDGLAAPEFAPPAGGLTETDDLDRLASLAQPLPQAVESSDARGLLTAPTVPSMAPALEQPLRPTDVAGLRPRPFANPNFKRNQTAPEFFGAESASPTGPGLNTEALGVLTDVAAALPRPPDVSFQPPALEIPEPLPTKHQIGVLPTDIRAYQPEPRGLDVVAALPDIAPSEITGTEDTTNQPSALDPIANAVRTALLDPALQSEVSAPPVRAEPPSDPEATATPPESEEPVPPVGSIVETPATISDSGGAEYRLFAPGSVSAATVNSVVADLTSTGHELSGTARVGFGIKQTNVRFYHQQDAAKAAALAKDSGALLRDFTGSSSKTQNGVIELWLAGESTGSPAVKRTATRSSRNASAGNQVQQLRSQVLKKLRTATNQ